MEVHHFVAFSKRLGSTAKQFARCTTQRKTKFRHPDKRLSSETNAELPSEPVNLKQVRNAVWKSQITPLSFQRQISLSLNICTKCLEKKPQLLTCSVWHRIPDIFNLNPISVLSFRNGSACNPTLATGNRDNSFANVFIYLDFKGTLWSFVFNDWVLILFLITKACRRCNAVLPAQQVAIKSKEMQQGGAHKGSEGDNCKLAITDEKKTVLEL